MDIISLEEFNQLPHKEQLAVHLEMKHKLGVKGILEAWNLSRNKYYYMVKKRNLNDDRSKKAKKPKQNAPAPDPGQMIAEQDVKTAIHEKFDRGPGEKISFDITIQGSTQVVSTVLESITEIYNTPDTVFEVNMSVKQL